MLEQIILIALLQGITEFLPISSSAHIYLVQKISPQHSGVTQDLALDVAVHFGTLMAVIFYNRRDLACMAISILTLGQRQKIYLSVAVSTCIATIPVVLAGYYLNQHDTLLNTIRGIHYIAWATIIFAIVLAIADNLAGKRRFLTISLSDGVIIGLAQVLALIPGTSRAGITITAARAIGIGRKAAVRFSMVLSIPVIIGAAVLTGGEALTTATTPKEWLYLGLAALVAMVVAFVAIKTMIAIILRLGFMPFVIYRIALGVVILFYIYFP